MNPRPAATSPQTSATLVPYPEKLRVLRENCAERAQVPQSAFAEVVLMNVGEAAMRRLPVMAVRDLGPSRRIGSRT